MPPADDALDELFGVVPEAFVATRDRIVRDLKAEGEPEAAARVKAMKRPTLATWSLNRLAHDDADVVAEYLDASRALRNVQERGGDRDALLVAMRRHRDAQYVLVDRAVAHAATQPGNPERVRNAVQDTLETAALDDGIADALQRGRLTSTERAVSAFEVLDVQPLARAASASKAGQVRGGKPAVTRASAARPPTVDEVRVERARVALEAAERTTAAARAQLAAAEQAEGDAREELRRARQPR